MKNFFLFLSLFGIFLLKAHPMPNSVVLLDIHPEKINAEIQIPLKELQYAVSFPLDEKTTHLSQEQQVGLKKYLEQHIVFFGKNGKKWKLELMNMKIDRAEQTATGIYHELVAYAQITPENTADFRDFNLFYDAVVHQVVTHKILVSIRQDWENGKIGEGHYEIGDISTDTKTGKVLPLNIKLEKGNIQKGFISMLKLGMKHISEGIDHLMFLLMLLLTAPLLPFGRTWIQNKNLKTSVSKTLKVTLAFTIGHSVTLVLATLGIAKFPVNPIEILIAFSILVTAVHAIIPLFPQKEVWVAACFGLIHGLAFSTVLSELHLSSVRLALSLLAFNLGIEIMQLLIIVLVMPLLLYWSRFKIYDYLRVLLASLALISSVFWMMERVTGKPNYITQKLEFLAQYSFL